MVKTLKIHSIETFGVHDGPGIRLVVFVQGCPFRCLYCHNPDTQELETAKTQTKTIDEILAGITKTPTFNKTCKDFLKTVKSENKKKYYAERLDAIFIPYSILSSK